ncbi:hypothetical protein [Sphingomonas sp. Leaf205]|uniref:hypothetical protein n=1 Tax=Sphingomonas sp. Leaf205 TaxID=2876551 RepID=UPI001E3C52BB|nr:hypothetical protein [Sphingomonas sp. Leaf205]
MNGLPETFTIREAFDLLGWQGSRKGLARHLQSEGFTSTMARIPGDAGARMIWRHPKPALTIESCPCRCHTGTCGANDMDLAERAIRLVQILRPRDAKMLEAIEYLVNRAGVDHAKATLNPVDLDSDVPF